MEHWWNDTYRGIPKYKEKDLPKHRNGFATNLVPEICVSPFVKQWRGTYSSVGFAVSIFINHVIAEHWYHLSYSVAFQEPPKTSLYTE